MTAAPTSPGRASTPVRLDRATIAIAAGLLAVTVLSLYLRTRAIGAGFWMDEGLSVGIASHDLLDIPGTLRQDGSPPLYYMLLHVWMDAFGSTEARTHVLSLLFATASIPAGLWVGWSLFGRRAGVILMALCGLNAFLTSHYVGAWAEWMVRILGGDLRHFIISTTLFELLGAALGEAHRRLEQRRARNGDAPRRVVHNVR